MSQAYIRFDVAALVASGQCSKSRASIASVYALKPT